MNQKEILARLEDRHIPYERTEHPAVRTVEEAFPLPMKNCIETGERN